MATYTVIANNEVDAESPITESLMTRLRDNPIAITEAATGAPRVQSDTVTGNASAISSDAAYEGLPLTVSTTADPNDVSRRLVVPLAPIVDQTTSDTVDTSDLAANPALTLTGIMVAGQAWLVYWHITYLDENAADDRTKMISGYVKTDGTSIASQSALISIVNNTGPAGPSINATLAAVSSSDLEISIPETVNALDNYKTAGWATAQRVK